MSKKSYNSNILDEYDEYGYQSSTPFEDAQVIEEYTDVYGDILGEAL